MMGDKEDSHGFGDVWRMDDSNQNGGHTCTKTATENPNNPKLKGSRIVWVFNCRFSTYVSAILVGIVHSPDVTESMRILFVSHHPIKIWVRIEIMNIEKTFPSIQPHLARF